MLYDSLTQFYHSKEWKHIRQQAIQRATNEKGLVIDEITREPIVNAYDMIVHHVIELMPSNVNDLDISLNLDNLKVVSFKTHNDLHQRFGQVQRKVYWVWGSPFAGKLDFVKKVKSVNDLVLDTGSLWNALNGGMGDYFKPKSLKSVIFAVRNSILDSVLTRNGTWNNAWIINSTKDEGLINRLDAEDIFVSANKDDCLEKAREIGLDSLKYTEQWWEYCVPNEEIYNEQ